MEASEDLIAPTVTRTANLEAPSIFEELQPQPPSAVDPRTSVFGGKKMEIEMEIEPNRGPKIEI